AVVAPPGVALGILVGQGGTHRCHHGRRGLVLAGDQLDAGPLPVQLGDQDLGDLRVLLQELGVTGSVVGVGCDLGAHSVTVVNPVGARSAALSPRWARHWRGCRSPCAQAPLVRSLTRRRAAADPAWPGPRPLAARRAAPWCPAPPAAGWP